MIFEPLLPWFILIIASVVVVIATVACIVNRKLRKSSNFIRLGILAMMLLALFRPLFPFAEETTEVRSNVVLYFIIDNTGSMAVEDENDEARIEVLKKDVQKIINSFDAPKVSVFSEDLITHRILPVTTDINAALNLIGNMQTKNTLSGEGTDLNRLLKSAAEYMSDYHNKNEDSEIIVFFMSDGENLVKSSKDTNVLDKKDFDYASYGGVIGYGSVDGGKVPLIMRTGDDNPDEIGYERHGTIPYIVVNDKEVISKLDENYLKDVANTYRFTYGKTNNIDNMIESAKAELGKKLILTKSQNIKTSFETYWIFMMIAGILMMVEFSRDFNSLLAEREAKK